MTSLSLRLGTSTGAFAALIAAALSVFTRDAYGGFDPWRVARQPLAAKARVLADALDRERTTVDPYLQDSAAQQKLNQRCAVRLELSGLESTHEERLLFLFGDCLSEAPGQYQEQARAAWRRALELYPNSPESARAYSAIALSSLALDDPAAALDAIGHALAFEWQAEVRARLFCAAAQIEMQRKQLDVARVHFLAAVSEAQELETRALAEWGWAVALDRAHDFPAALTPARDASRARFGGAGRTSVLDLDGALLFPSFDAHYYRALGLMAEALADAANPARTAQLQSAQLMWIQYLDAAPETDPWIARVREHLDWLHRELGADDDD
ncbi:MAG TPA: hypothetical protein VHM70_19760 [Polyangiaceae bacterium]|jgi:hypothetical protein|nr:hypothetical protein [Polyangiaceae bacterium]